MRVRRSKNALLTRRLCFICQILTTPQFDWKIRFHYIPLGNDISVRLVPRSTLQDQPLAREAPGSADVILGPPLGLLNEILLASGIFPKLIASIEPRIPVEAYLLIPSDRKIPFLFKNLSFKRLRPIINPLDATV